jgi:two-component system LytT family response regulator
MKKENALISLLVFLILYILQPLGFSGYSGNKLLISFGFAVVTFISLTLCSIFLPTRTHKTEERTFKQLFIPAIIYGFAIGLANFIFAVFAMPIQINLHEIINVCYIALVYFIVVGGIVYLISTNIYLHRKVEELKPNISTHDDDTDNIITIHDQNVRTNDLVLSSNDFLYAEVNHNNVTVHYLSENQMMTKDIRTTLKNVLNGINSPYIFQCHRSYIVNITNVLSATGNMNGYKLKIRDDYHKVTVSRSFANVFLSKFHPEK